MIKRTKGKKIKREIDTNIREISKKQRGKTRNKMEIAIKLNLLLDQKEKELQEIKKYALDMLTKLQMEHLKLKDSLQS